jgi:hypothetical protein
MQYPCNAGEGVSEMPRNGETAAKSGVYKTLCCDAEIVIGIGVLFPGCPNHKDLCTEWKPLEANPDGDSMYESNPSNSENGMITSVASWRCRCGVSVKIVTEVELTRMTEANRLEASCPNCGDKQTIYGHRIIAATIENRNG